MRWAYMQPCFKRKYAPVARTQAVLRTHEDISATVCASAKMVSLMDTALWYGDEAADELAQDGVNLPRQSPEPYTTTTT